MADCLGTPESHCCNLGALGVCGFLEVDDPARHGLTSCRLRRRHVSWEAVHDSGEYQSVGVIVRGLVGVDCGYWPTSGETCATCGVTGG